MSSNGLKEGCEIVLKNENGLKKENGGTWNFVLKHHKSNNVTVISPGWRSFCDANGLKARDFFRFKLVRTGARPVLCLCTAETNSNRRLLECSEGTNVNSLSTDPSSGEESSETEESEEKKSLKNKGREGIIVKEDSEEESITDKSSLRECLNKEKWKYCSRPGASSSPSQDRFVTLTVTRYSVKNNKLVCLKIVYYMIGFLRCVLVNHFHFASIKSFVQRLPVHFTRVNGINKPGKITLLGQDGVAWKVHLVRDNIIERMRLGRDWKGFCEAHDVKIGESVVFELIREKDASPVLRFITKVKSV